MKSMGGDQCSVSLSLSLSLSPVALYISSNNHHRGQHLAHRFPVQDSQTPPGQEKKAPLTPSVQHPQLHTQGGRAEEEEKERSRGGENTLGEPDREGWKEG